MRSSRRRSRTSAAGSFFRISSLCFAEPQPWLPSTGSFDGAAFAALLERQIAQGFLRFGADGAVEAG